MSVELVLGSDGDMIPLDSVEQVIARDGSGNITSITVRWKGKTYVRTISRTDGHISATSAWVLQS